jgi:S-methylmethionine-dependent homocysteine/selenocysteine methylase/SAM-dependent methyltransferase
VSATKGGVGRPASSATGHSPAYARIQALLAAERCVILDGAVATELQRLRPLDGPEPDTELWGTWALYRAPESVLDVHRRYVDVGCDVVSTDTWSILSAPEMEMRASPGQPELVHWMDVARLGIRLARQAVREGGRNDECAVAFAISEDVTSTGRKGTLDLLTRAFEDEPPDLILLETLTLIRDPLTFETIEALLETGLPVWVSFRRCRHGVCGVYGQHWGPPEGDLFGRAARRFETMGVGALLMNCLPVDHVPGMLPWLRDFTDLPLGVYPNLGYLANHRWRFDERIGPEEYARLALEWRAEGAQIVGGCCGTTPEHIRAAATALEGTKPGRRRTEAGREAYDADAKSVTSEVQPEPWVDKLGRRLFPLPFPELMVDPGVFVPTQGSYLLWKHLFRSGAGEGQACLDVGCGCGILSLQLALNGATRVHAIDIDRNAVANTLANGFRNGVADRMTGEDVDLYQWEPAERFGLVVASLYQMPVDPYEEPTGHRPLDYWGRNLLDHLVVLLPRLLAEGGRALIMQLSIVGQQRTAYLLEQAGLEARVVDFAFFPFGPLFQANREQIRRVEQLSDAYHLTPGGEDVMVAYLLEVARPSPAAKTVAPT